MFLFKTLARFLELPFFLSDPTVKLVILYALQGPLNMSPSLDLPPKGGFSFDLCRRNAMLQNKGLKAPTFLKTGTTIVGLVFQVSIIPSLLSYLYDLIFIYHICIHRCVLFVFLSVCLHSFFIASLLCFFFFYRNCYCVPME